MKKGYSGSKGLNPGVMKPYAPSQTNKPRGVNGKPMKKDTKYM